MQCLSVAALLWCLVAPPPAAAQSDAQSDAQSAAPATRAAALDAERGARERNVEATQATATTGRHPIEAALLFVDEKRILERLNPPQGFYPALGGVTPGSGYGLGVGYRIRPDQGRAVIDLSGTITWRRYRQVQGQVTWPEVGGSPLNLRLGLRQFNFTQEDYFGLGPGSRRQDRVSFGLEGSDGGVTADARLGGWLVVGARGGLQLYDVERGTDPGFPSIEEIFTDETAPGLADDLTLGYVEAMAALDTRDEPGNTRSGSLLMARYGAYRNAKGRAVEFNRLDLEALHVFHIFDKKRAIALHAVASSLDPLGGTRLPFYVMPTIGGGTTVRNLRDFRLRDATTLVLNAEYRWEAFSALDMAIFADAADVGTTWKDLTLRHFYTAWGLGFRFNTNRQVFLRLDIAKGNREGMRAIVRMGPVF